MKEEKAQNLIKKIAKELKIPYSICNKPKEIIIKLNTKSGWTIVLDEKRKTYQLIC